MGTRLLHAWLIVLAIATSAPADSLDARFLEGLRERRLFQLAETYCADRLSRVNPLETARAELTVELMRTFALHAMNAPPHDRGPLWAKAHAIAADFARQSPPHPRAVLVWFQDALTQLAQGELARQELEAGALPADGLESARQSLRRATALLEALDKELKSEVLVRRRTPPRAGELSASELTGLGEQVEHQLGRAQKNRALLFERGSDDRLSLLLAATDTLQRALPQVPDDQPLKATLLLDLAECQRLLGRYPEAAELAASLDQEGAPPPTRLKAHAELIRVAIGENNLDMAQRLIEPSRATGQLDSADYEFARFEALLALARAASQGKRVAADPSPPSELAKRYADDAARTADVLEASYGPYWGRRASQLLITALPRGAAANIELLGRVADGLYLKGDLERALAAYDDAAGQARTSGDLPAAFSLSYKAALIEQKRNRPTAAADRLRTLAKSSATHSQASQAHLLAAWNIAQEVKNDSSATRLYEELLAEHLALWPTAESADQARMWLGNSREAAANWAGAIDAYAAVSRSSKFYAEAISSLARCCREEMASLAAAGKPPAEAAMQAVGFFKRAIAGPENRWPERWTQADRTAAAAAAELIVAHQPGSASDAEELLRRALAASSDAPPAWRTAAQAQLVVALAAQGGRQNDARAELEAIGTASPAQMLAVLEGLSQVAARASERTRPAIAQVQLEAIARLAGSRGQLNPDQQLALDRVQADALATMGRRGEALASYSQLAKAHPESGAIQEGYARLLLTSPDLAHLKQALEQWRIVASRSKPRTPRWYEAKYSVALAEFKLGDRAGAATLLRYILESPPGLNGTGWETAYTELLRKCGP